MGFKQPLITGFLNDVSNIQAPPPSAKRFKCLEDGCSFSTNRRFNLRIHQDTHSGLKHPCDQCPKSFSQLQVLTRHKQSVHSSERKFACDECDFKCARKDLLQKHKLIHRDDKPFKCGHCDYSCVQKGQLTAHVRTHTGDKPYKCTECPAAFTQSGNLRIHLNYHESSKSWTHTCPYQV